MTPGRTQPVGMFARLAVIGLFAFDAILLMWVIGQCIR